MATAELLKAMLLATSHDLSDGKLEETLADRASFRRFCRFSVSEPTPERAAFVRLPVPLVQTRSGSQLIDTATRRYPPFAGCRHHTCRSADFFSAVKLCLRPLL